MININSKDWEFKKSFTDFDRVYINGINIWDYKWNQTSQYITVSHPTHKEQTYYKQILFIENENIIYYFIAFEFSMNSWGLYLKDDYEVKLKIYYGESIFDKIKKLMKK
jgi:hypothetical protein